MFLVFAWFPKVRKKEKKEDSPKYTIDKNST